jgi:hypothetical protein
MKLTTKMLKQIIKEELESVIGEVDYPSPFYDGKRSAENGEEFDVKKYPDASMQRKYAKGYASVSAAATPQKAKEPEAKIEPQKDQEAVGMPEPMAGQDEYEPRSPSGVGAQPAGRGYSPASKKISQKVKQIQQRRLRLRQ